MMTCSGLTYEVDGAVDITHSCSVCLDEHKRGWIGVYEGICPLCDEDVRWYVSVDEYLAQLDIGWDTWWAYQCRRSADICSCTREIAP